MTPAEAMESTSRRCWVSVSVERFLLRGLVLGDGERRGGVRVEFCGEFALAGLGLALEDLRDDLRVALGGLHLEALDVRAVADGAEAGPERGAAAHLVDAVEVAQKREEGVRPLLAVGLYEGPRRAASLVVEEPVLGFAALGPGDDDADGLAVLVLDDALVLGVAGEGRGEVGLDEVADAVRLEGDDLAGVAAGDGVVEDEGEVAADVEGAEDEAQQLGEAVVVEVLRLLRPVGEGAVDLAALLLVAVGEGEDGLAAFGADDVVGELVEDALHVLAVARGVAGEGD
jgi:hypothetical protein